MSATIRKLRQANHYLFLPLSEGPEKVVQYLGAMQSQTLDYARWAVGIRSKGCGDDIFADAVEHGKIVRLHILRPTWHFVHIDDLSWMSRLSRRRLKPVYESYCRAIGLDMITVNKALPLIERALQGGQHLTKQQIVDRLNQYGLKTDNNMISVILSHAEIGGIICGGRFVSGKHSYRLAEELININRDYTIEESLAELARRYFHSHGPATIEDFVWWSGLSLTEARKGLELVKSEFISEDFLGREMWMTDPQPFRGKKRSKYLLPPFDEYVVAYKDRSDIIEDCHYAKVMTKNGLFSPTVMNEGEIVGSWKKAKVKNGIKVELSFFENNVPQEEYVQAKTEVETYYNYTKA